MDLLTLQMAKKYCDERIDIDSRTRIIEYGDTAVIPEEIVDDFVERGIITYVLRVSEHSTISDTLVLYRLNRINDNFIIFNQCYFYTGTTSSQILTVMLNRETGAWTKSSAYTGIFNAEYGVTTYQQIEEVLALGTLGVQLIYNDRVYYLFTKSASYCMFLSVQNTVNSNTIRQILLKADNTWSTSNPVYLEHCGDGGGAGGNKVSSLNDTFTDDVKYPSAKAVKEYIDSKLSELNNSN